MMTPSDLSPHHASVHRLVDGLNDILFGQEVLIRAVVTGLLAGGHILLEGLPGLGKTELVKGLAALSGLEPTRIQFTPDLLPSDITGSPVLEERDGHRTLVFQPGPVFGQIVLADEINRASPKTQAALLEAMQEGAVTVLGTTHPLPRPFFVLATQNPVELDGTYPLPEAQLDRFLFKLNISPVGPQVLKRLLIERPTGRRAPPDPLMGPDGIANLLEIVRSIILPEAVADYIARLVSATRPDGPGAPPKIREGVRWGASPRAAIGLAAACRASALIDGRPSAGFEDVKRSALAVLGHRVVTTYEARLDGFGPEAMVDALLKAVPEVGS